MMMKLTSRSGLIVYVDTSRVILAEEHPAGWFLTVEALEKAPLGPPNSGIYSGSVNASRVLDLDRAGASPLIAHLEGRSKP